MRLGWEGWRTARRCQEVQASLKFSMPPSTMSVVAAVISVARRLEASSALEATRP